jgi:3-phenylpropionate/trans-cinnamate dioxygenase ferredoxin reductase subunit
MDTPSVLILGTGLAGFQVAAAIRDEGYEGDVTLVGDEVHMPYHRPPLSKAYLLGTSDEVRLAMRPEQFYTDKRIGLITGRRAVAIDRPQRKVTFDDGSVLEYGHLVLAVGARNRPLPAPGADLDGVFFLRTLDEARMLRERMLATRRAIIIGAGFIGLEFAAAAVKSGVDVTVLDVADRPMARALSPQMSAVFTREHTLSGVHFSFNTQVARILGDAGRVTGVETADGAIVPGELVIIGIGVLPNDELAAACGLEVKNGIVVDAHMQTSDPHISALGDCAAHPSVYANGGSVRIESVQNATDQARCVAARLLDKPAPYTSAPWFWSDQGDLKLQIAGLTTGFDQIAVRGDLDGKACTIFCFRDGRLLGVETVNRPADHMVARRLVKYMANHADNIVVLTPEQAGDDGFDLKQHAAALGA